MCRRPMQNYGFLSLAIVGSQSPSWVGEGEAQEYGQQRPGLTSFWLLIWAWSQGLH